MRQGVLTPTQGALSQVASTSQNAVKGLPGGSEALSPAFKSYVVETYWDDPYGYGLDILGNDEEECQKKILNTLADDAVRRVACQSGHGIGKTRGLATTGIHWFMATRPQPAVVATANTEAQLKDKLWRELNKVNNEAKNKEWFKWESTTFRSVENRTAQATAIPWSESNPEAFAGTHEEYVLGVFDESSGIPESIWSTFSGAMSTSGAKWLALGNPTRNTGYFFRACNGNLKWRRTGDDFAGKWRAFTVPSWESTRVAPQWVEEMRETLSDEEFRYRVAGLPPLQSIEQFMPADLVDKAAHAQVEMRPRSPLVLGVDVARHQKDRSVIVPRLGNIVPERIIECPKGIPLPDVARMVVDEINWWRKTHKRETRAICVEGGGSIGWGVIDPLMEWGFEQVEAISPGMRSIEPEFYANRRCEMWGRMKAWFGEDEVQIPNHELLIEELLEVKSLPDDRSRVRLESKDKLRSRFRSPDFADALALTFAAEVELEPDRETKMDMWSTDDDRESYSETAWMYQ